MYSNYLYITLRTLFLTILTSSISLSAMSHQYDETQTVKLIDSVGGNEQIFTLPLPDDGSPLALPNPDVFQKHINSFKESTTSITLNPEEQTELKLAMTAGQVVVYSWTTVNESLYIDFHGHQPDEESFFVRYEELDEGKMSHGSLAAPFDGHHGWYLLNMTTKPVTIVFKISGFYSEMIPFEISSSSPF